MNIANERRALNDMSDFTSWKPEGGIITEHTRWHQDLPIAYGMPWRSD